MNEMGPNSIEELSNLRKKSTEYILQQNFKAALPLVEKIVKSLPRERHNEVSLTEDDLYVINCAHCLCVLHENFDKAETILSNIEAKFKFKMPLLYFMFCKEYFKRGLLADVKVYAQKFLKAYYENLFKEKCKIYYWIANIPVKYEQFSTIKELTNEVLEQLSCKENTNENALLLREIFVALEEVLFYTQTEDCIKKSFYEINPVSVDGFLHCERAEKRDLSSSKATVNTQTESLRTSDFSVQINLDRKPPIVETSSQTNINLSCVATQTCFPKKQTATQVNIPNRMDGEEKLKEKIRELEDLIEEQKNTIKNQDEKCKKLWEEKLIESAKWEVRFEILEEQLFKMKDSYENGIKEIATLQANLRNECVRNCNLQMNIYSQYVKKCNKMLRDLNNVLPHLTQISLPTSSECSTEINLWKDELCKAEYCKQLLKLHEENLKLKFDPKSFPMALPDIPDCPIEARDILHDSFKPVMLTVIKNEAAQVRMVTSASPIVNYVQGPSLRYPVMPCNSNMMPGYISSPFHQPTIFPQPIKPPVQTQPKPPTPNLSKVVKNNADDGAPLSKTIPTPPISNCSNNDCKSNSSNSSCSETNNIDWIFKTDDTKIAEESDLSASLNTPLPLSSLMKFARQNKDGDGSQHTTHSNGNDDDDKSNDETFKKSEFKATYAYLKQNLPLVPEEELLNILKIVKEQNPEDFYLVTREEILNRSIRIIFEDDK